MNCPECGMENDPWGWSYHEDEEGYSIYECPWCTTDFYVEELAEKRV